MLLAGVAHVGSQALLPHALMFKALEALAQNPDGLMKHLGYPTVPPIDESLPRRLARFGLLYLPFQLAERVAKDPLFATTLDIRVWPLR